MLMKLLKHDFRSNLKIFGFIWPAIIVFCLMERLMLSIEIDNTLFDGISFIGVGVLFLALIVANVFAFILSIIRFYSGLLGREGYLMFTLPVKPWQLLLSKLIVALTTMLVTLVLSVGGAYFVFSGYETFTQIFDYLFSSLDSSTRLTMILLCIMPFFSMCLSLLQVYLCGSLGQLFRKNRILWCVLIYFGINIAMEIISSVITFGIIFLSGFDSMSFLMNFDLNVYYVFSIILSLTLATVYFFVSERILRKRLNLE